MERKVKAGTYNTTEEKILIAARKVFSDKGYAATRTRDIAEEAGINLALVNYYFRSKERLFSAIMQEKVYQLFGTVVPILTNPSIILEEKIQIVANTYIDMLNKNPDLPILVFNEIKKSPNGFGAKMQLGPVLKESSFAHQLKERNPNINPLQFILSFLAMIVFPYVTKNILIGVDAVDKASFDKLMLERKKLIPLWIESMLRP